MRSIKMNGHWPWIGLRSTSTLLLTLLLIPVSMAAETESSSLGNVVIPQPSKPENALSCVAPTDIMRRDHMKFLFQQRDNTVYRGVRSKQFSLSGCINCHAQPTATGEIVRSDNAEYFCTGCHVFASVKIDCFECHSDQPVDTAYLHKLDRENQPHLAKVELASVSQALHENILEILNRQAERRDN